MTAEKVILYLIPNAKTEMSVKQFENAVNVIKEYSKQGIKADRINLLKHVKTKEKKWKRSCSSGYESGTNTVIDKDSIINAPNIQLL